MAMDSQFSINTTECLFPPKSNTLCLRPCVGYLNVVLQDEVDLWYRLLFGLSPPSTFGFYYFILCLLEAYPESQKPVLYLILKYNVKITTIEFLSRYCDWVRTMDLHTFRLYFISEFGVFPALLLQFYPIY